MGLSQRRKGRLGQSVAANLLRSRDWVVDEISAGIRREDLVATDPNGRGWSVEVKNAAGILPGHKKQAMEQAAKRRLPWLLMSHISGTSSWLVQRQGERPVVWHNGEAE